MDQPTGNKPGRSAIDGRRPADLLRERISSAQQDPRLKVFARDLLPVLGMLDAYLADTEYRLNSMDRALRILFDERGP